MMPKCHDCGAEVEPGLYTCPTCGAMPAQRGLGPPGGMLVQFCLALGQLTAVIGCLVGLFQVGAVVFFAQRFAPLFEAAGAEAPGWWTMVPAVLPGLMIFGLSAGLWGVFTRLKQMR